MITLITGAPGAGKSAALVDLLRQLAPGRTVYAHGIPDLKIDHQPLDEPSKWMDNVPDGSIIVIDEVQTVWRPKGPGQGVPPDIQALETHRHRGLDFFIVTQAPRLLHTNVRALVGRHVHLRDVGFLGRYWYEWPECAENCTASFKTAPIRKKYKLPKAAFALYKSASVHIKPIRSFPVMVFVALIAIAGVAALTYYVGAKVLLPANSKPSGTPTAPPSINQGLPNTAPVRHPPPASFESKPMAFDQTQFFPVDPKVPQSAPAYDHLRVVVNMPRVAGGICGKSGCKCYSEQGTVLGMSSEDCERLVASPTYDPWRVERVNETKNQPPPEIPALPTEPVKPLPDFRAV